LKWQKQEAPTPGWVELYDNGAEAWLSAKQFLVASRRRNWLNLAQLTVSRLLSLRCSYFSNFTGNPSRAS
jgi:hypothetical protein